jgi:hypothetical protein
VKLETQAGKARAFERAFERKARSSSGVDGPHTSSGRQSSLRKVFERTRAGQSTRNEFRDAMPLPSGVTPWNAVAIKRE